MSWCAWSRHERGAWHQKCTTTTVQTKRVTQAPSPWGPAAWAVMDSSRLSTHNDSFHTPVPTPHLGESTGYTRRRRIQPWRGKNDWPDPDGALPLAPSETHPGNCTAEVISQEFPSTESNIHAKRWNRSLATPPEEGWSTKQKASFSSDASPEGWSLRLSQNVIMTETRPREACPDSKEKGGG